MDRGGGIGRSLKLEAVGLEKWKGKLADLLTAIIRGVAGDWNFICTRKARIRCVCLDG